jgi:hypothetical protein
MSRTLKILALVAAIVALLALAIGGTIYATGAGPSGCGDSTCSQDRQRDCDGAGGKCDGANECQGTPHCRNDGRS